MDKPKFRLKRPRFGSKNKKKCNAEKVDVKLEKKNESKEEIKKVGYGKDESEKSNISISPRDQSRSNNITCNNKNTQTNITGEAEVPSTVASIDRRDNCFNDKSEASQIATRKHVKKLPRPSSTSVCPFSSKAILDNNMSEENKLSERKSLPSTPAKENSMSRVIIKTKKQQKENKPVNRGIPVLTTNKCNDFKSKKSIPKFKPLKSKQCDDANENVCYGSIPNIPMSKHVPNASKEIQQSKTLPRPNVKSPAPISSRNSIEGDSVASSLSEASKEVYCISKIQTSGIPCLKRRRTQSSSPQGRSEDPLISNSNTNGRRSDPAVVGWRALASDRLRLHIDKGKNDKDLWRPISPLELKKFDSPCNIVKRQSLDNQRGTESTNGSNDIEAVISHVERKQQIKGILHNTMSSRNDLRCHKAPIHRLNATVDGLNSILDKLTSTCQQDDRNSLNSSTCSLYSENFSDGSNSVPDIFNNSKRNITASATTPRSRQRSYEHNNCGWSRNRSFFLRCTEVRRKQHRKEWENNRYVGATDRFSSFAQRDNVIKKLKVDLEDARQTISMQESEILLLRQSISEIKDVAAEEECGRVEAEIKRVQAENDSRMLGATVQDLKNTLSELRSSQSSKCPTKLESMNNNNNNLTVRTAKTTPSKTTVDVEGLHYNSHADKNSIDTLKPENSDVTDSNGFDVTAGEWVISKTLHGSLPGKVTTNENKASNFPTNLVTPRPFIFRGRIMKLLHVIFICESFTRMTSINRYQVEVIDNVLKNVFKQYQKR